MYVEKIICEKLCLDYYEYNKYKMLIIMNITFI